jgi:CRP/FNR family cyclic AMP-dependent transcriptional regulator
MRSAEESGRGGGVTTEETADLLAQVPMFSELSADELRHLAEVAVPRSYVAGEVVFRAGDKGDTCYVVRDGAVRVTRRHSDGRAITLAELRRGQMFGELALFDGETRSATVEATEETTAVALLAGDVRRTLARHPEIAVKMLGALADRLRAANERIARQAFQTVAGRVASVLRMQVETLADGDPEPREVLISATQADIAQLAGTSRESASRFLASLERAGVVTCGRGKVVVHDPAALDNYIY